MNNIVSIVIPLYNHEKYICETLDSCFSQTYRNIEIILIDDCSVDNGFQLAKDYALKKGFKNIKFYHNDNNLGSFENINKGICLSSGSLINIINSDDIFSKNRIESLLKVRPENKSFFCAFSNFDIIFNKKYNETDYFDILYSGDELRSYPSVSWAFMKKNYAISTGNWLFSRDLYDYIGGFSNYKYCLDWDFFIRCSKITEPVFVDECLYHYRIHDNNSFMKLSEFAQIETQNIFQHYSDTGVGIENPKFPCERNYGDIFPKLKNYILGT